MELVTGEKKFIQWLENHTIVKIRNQVNYTIWFTENLYWSMPKKEFGFMTVQKKKISKN
jgi:hypothetical protein